MENIILPLDYLIIGLMGFNLFIVAILAYTIYRISSVDRYTDIVMERLRAATKLAESRLVELEMRQNQHDNEIESIKINIESLRADIHHLELGMARFAPPLDKNTNYATITASKTIA